MSTQLVTMFTDTDNFLVFLRLYKRKLENVLKMEQNVFSDIKNRFDNKNQLSQLIWIYSVLKKWVNPGFNRTRDNKTVIIFGICVLFSTTISSN